LEHDNGTQQTWYAHLSEIFVRPGETIQQGAVIGRVGMTGTATGPNLHFELRQNTETGWVAVNSYVTPGNLLGQASSSSQSPSSGRSSSSAARISNIQHFGLLAGTVERSQNQTD
jgi:murein DD-endopeptidase MepM/ murein hydrolase activator NlpD